MHIGRLGLNLGRGRLVVEDLMVEGVTAVDPPVPVPDFTLTDQQGRVRSLDSLMGPRGLMLVFSRSADW